MAVVQTKPVEDLASEAPAENRGRGWVRRFLLGLGTLGVVSAAAIGLVVAGLSDSTENRPATRGTPLDEGSTEPVGRPAGSLSPSDDPLVVRFGAAHGSADVHDPLVVRFGAADGSADVQDPLVVRFG